MTLTLNLTLTLRLTSNSPWSWLRHFLCLSPDPEPDSNLRPSSNKIATQNWNIYKRNNQHGKNKTLCQLMLKLVLSYPETMQNRAFINCRHYSSILLLCWGFNWKVDYIDPLFTAPLKCCTCDPVFHQTISCKPITVTLTSETGCSHFMQFTAIGRKLWGLREIIVIEIQYNSSHI